MREERETRVRERDERLKDRETQTKREKEKRTVIETNRARMSQGETEV